MGESGKGEEFKGRAKKAAGELTKDRELEREGEKDKTAGKAKQKAERTIDKVREKLDR